ncbi:DUF3916 domain-containing protein [Arthrobacter citreus]|nr:DUF3916 domain-containing protein [Arthrobacter citreus]
MKRRYKKVRGLKRLIKKFKREWTKLTEKFPIEMEQYWECHVPTRLSDLFISPKTPISVKKQCIQLMIDRTSHLIKLKPSNREKLRILLTVDFRDWNSTKIDIFTLNESNTFWMGYEDEYSKGVPIDVQHHLTNKWKLSVPIGMGIACVREEIKDSDLIDEDIKGGEICYFGEIN